MPVSGGGWGLGQRHHLLFCHACSDDSRLLRRPARPLASEFGIFRFGCSLPVNGTEATSSAVRGRRMAQHSSKITHRSIPSPGGRIHLVEQGTGPLVVLVHGFPESWYSW